MPDLSSRLRLNANWWLCGEQNSPVTPWPPSWQRMNVRRKTRKATTFSIWLRWVNSITSKFSPVWTLSSSRFSMLLISLQNFQSDRLFISDKRMQAHSVWPRWDVSTRLQYLLGECHRNWRQQEISQLWIDSCESNCGKWKIGYAIRVKGEMRCKSKLSRSHKFRMWSENSAGWTGVFGWTSLRESIRVGNVIGMQHHSILSCHRSDNRLCVSSHWKPLSSTRILTLASLSATTCHHWPENNTKLITSRSAMCLEFVNHQRIRASRMPAHVKQPKVKQRRWASSTITWLLTTRVLRICDTNRAPSAKRTSIGPPKSNSSADRMMMLWDQESPKTPIANWSSNLLRNWLAKTKWVFPSRNERMNSSPIRYWTTFSDILQGLRRR